MHRNSFTNCYIVFFILFFSLNTYSQEKEKLEREYRISAKSVPEKARKLIASLPFDKKIKWFKEESFYGNTIEAKTKFKKHKYSIEFDTLGNVQDIEVVIPETIIPKTTLENIRNSIKKEFKWFKFVKIQEQFIGTQEQIVNYIKTRNQQNFIVKFEIEFKGKKGGEKHLYLYTFSENGSIEQRERVVFENIDHLEH